MPNACKQIGVRAPSRKNLNLSQSNNKFYSILNELNPYIKKASARISFRMRAYDKDDLAQEARLRLFQTFQRKSQKDLPYFKRTAVNAMLDAYSSENPHKSEFVKLDEKSGVNAVFTNATSHTDQLSVIVAVRNWINKLPIHLQRVYQLLYVKDYTQREAADILNISQARVAQLHKQLKARGNKELQHLHC